MCLKNSIYSVQIILRLYMQLCFYHILAASNRTKEWALSLKYHLIKSLEEWVDDSRHAFPKAVTACLSHFIISSAFSVTLVPFLSNAFGLFGFCQDSPLLVHPHPYFWDETHEPNPPASSSLQMPADPGGHQYRHQRRAIQRDSLQQHSDPSVQHQSGGHHLQFQGDL